MRTKYILFLSAILIPLTISTSVFAAITKGPRRPVSLVDLEIEAYFESTGRILVELLAGVVQDEAAQLKLSGEANQEFPVVAALEPGSHAEDTLVDELDQSLARAFTHIAHYPNDKTINEAVQELYYLFIKHVGSEMLNSEHTAELLKAEIRRVVKPLKQRHPNSCMALLSGNQYFENLH